MAFASSKRSNAMDKLLGTRAQPERWSRSGSLCAEVGTGRAVLSPRPFPRSGSLPPLRFGQFFLDEAEHFLHRMASVATLRGCSGSSRNAGRLPFGNSVRLRRNPHFQLNCLNKAFDLIEVAHFAIGPLGKVTPAEVIVRHVVLEFRPLTNLQSNVYHHRLLEVGYLPWPSIRGNARMYSREPWTCSSCEHFFMVQRMVMRLASIFSGPPMTSFKCNTALSTLRCTDWSEGDGSPPSGKWLRIAIGNSSITDLRKRAENNLWSKNRNGSRWRKLSDA